MKYLLVSLLIATSLIGCKVSFVPAASAEIKAQVENTAKMTDALYLGIEAASDKSYAGHAIKYAEINAEINSLVLKNTYRLKAVNFQNMINTVQVQFLQYESNHKTKGVLSAGEAKAYKNDMAGFWLPLIKSENLLK